MQSIILILLILAVILLIIAVKELRRLNTVEAEQLPDVAQEQSSTGLEKEYFSIIDKTPEEKQYVIIRHCFNRLPGSCALLKRLWKVQREQINKEESPPIIKRELIKDMNSAVSLYRQKCDIHSLDKVDNIVEEIETFSEDILKQLRQEEETELIELVSELEKRISELEAEDNEQLTNIEKIDSRIDKARLNRSPEIKARYDKCSSALMTRLKNEEKEESSEQKELEYNRKAVEKHKIALSKFNSENGVFKNVDVKGIVKLIGGWDNRYLFPATLTYTNSVYMSIFTKMGKENQLSMTELMIEAKKRTL